MNAKNPLFAALAAILVSTAMLSVTLAPAEAATVNLMAVTHA
jgi:hypothetical protein